MLVITDDTPRAQIEEAMTHLRAKQLRCCIPSTAAEVGADIDDLLDAWPSAPA